MDFREEYKKSMESNSPDRETIDRMKAAVMAQLENSAQNEVPEKKPLNMRRMYYAFGALAACAVIAVSAATILPNVSKNSEIVSAADTSSNAAAEITNGDETGSAESAAAGIADDSAMDAPEVCTEEIILLETEDSSGMLQTNEDIAYPNDTTSSRGDIPADTGNSGSDNGINSLPNESVIDTEPPKKSESTEIVDNVVDDANETVDIGDDKYDNAEAPDEALSTIEPDMDKGSVIEGTWEISETCDATEEITDDCFEETMESEETTESEPKKIIFSGKGWITYDGERYNEVNDVNGGGTIRTAYDPINKTYYNVVLYNGKLLVYDKNMYLKGAYIHA